MRNIAMFLGAGASKAFNYPLTKEILPSLIAEIRSGKLFEDDEIGIKERRLYQRLLKELFINLSPGLARSFDDKKIDPDNLPLVTDLLSQAEHLANHNHALADFNFEIKHSLLGDIETINERWSLKDVIIILEWAIINIINKKGINTKTRLRQFIKWLRETNSSKEAFVSIITSNYDCSVEWNVMEDGEGLEAHRLIDYGFNWRDVDDGEIYLRPVKPLFRFLKLHGSIDWLRCDRCGFIYINPTVDIYDLAFSNDKNYDNTCHCNYWPLSPVLVTPSFSRNVYDTNLAQVWRNTLEQLRTADEWIIVGYSLPGEDLDIRSLFIRALIGRRHRPVIKVIQQSKNAKTKYDQFFGKDNYEFIDGGFDKFDFSKIKIC